MYLEHFKFKTQPFSEHTSVTALWHDPRTEEAMARLNYLLQCGELGLFTGGSGVGKSALIKRFLNEISPQSCQSVYCHLTHISTGILKPIVSQIGETPRRGKERIYEQILEHASRVEGTLLLVVDEAHLLDGNALTDLRLLISSALEVRPPLKILLIGQEPLRGTLRKARHFDLLNRVSVRYHMRSFTQEQTCSYIDFQLTHAGGATKLFDNSVKESIYEFSGGVARQINSIATACLMQASSKNAVRIDDDVFRQAAAEFQMP